MKIRIVNLKNYRPRVDEVMIRVDRTSPVGNPFFMSDESKRDEVCDNYQKHFDKLIIKEGMFQDYIRNIYKVWQTNNVALGCWCYPKRCHAETILNFLLKYQNNSIN